jgi:DNA sulfur modification protein DndD
MRITKIVLENYRQFRNLEIDLKKDAPTSMHVFVAVMGTGKTNLLNAVNWCLYGHEPYLSLQSQQIPRLNLETLHSGQGQQEKTKVELWVESNSHKIIFTREEIFSVAERSKPTSDSSSFEVKTVDEAGNCDFLSAEESESYVERFVPTNIREFFFFDGERLDRYFREATAQNIKNAIFKISQVDILDTTIDHLHSVISELRRDAGKLNPEIERYRRSLEEKENELTRIRQEIENIEEQNQIAREHIERLRSDLEGIPDVEELQEEREQLKAEKGTVEKLCNEKMRDKHNYLFDAGRIIMLYPAVIKSLSIIEEKRERKEIPPTLDKVLLENILADNKCICKTDLNANRDARDAILKLLDSVRHSPEIANALSAMENPLILCSKELQMFKRNIETLTKEIQAYKLRLEELHNKISKIDKKIGGYDIEKIREWHRQMKSFENMLESNQERLGYRKSSRDKLEEEVKSLKELLDKELRKQSKSRRIQQSLKFSLEALSVVSASKSEIMGKIRREIESRTNDIFFALMWKKESFKKVSIDAGYGLHLTHKYDYDCLGSISGGEREVLALAFTLALHEVSGFDSPMIIDRPLAMVSGMPRNYIAEILAKISTEKQVILLLTPDDHASVKSILDSAACDSLRLNLLPNEKSVEMIEV